MILLLGYISSLSLIIPMLIVLRYYQIICGFKSKYVAAYITLGCLFEIIIYKQNAVTELNSKLFANVFDLIEIGLILYTYNIWSNYNKNKYIYIVLLSMYLLIWFWNMMANGIAELTSLINGSEALLVIIASICFLYDQYTRNENYHKWQITIGMAFLYYFIINSGIYSFTEFFLNINQKENWFYFAIIHFIGNVGMNILLATGLYQCSKQSLRV